MDTSQLEKEMEIYKANNPDKFPPPPPSEEMPKDPPPPPAAQEDIIMLEDLGPPAAAVSTSIKDWSDDMLKKEMEKRKKEKKRQETLARQLSKKSTSNSLTTLSTNSGNKRKKTPPKKHTPIKKQKVDMSMKQSCSTAKPTKRDSIFDSDSDDPSTDPEPDEVISLGGDSDDYEERKIARKERGRKIVPTVVQRRAQAIIRPKKAVFIHQCKKCRERQHKREEKIVYQTDAGGIYFLILELCATCMDSNLALAENYATVFNEIGQNEEIDDDFPRMDVQRGEDITGKQDKKLLRQRLAWVLHQCETCRLQQKHLAHDLFIHKIDEQNYELTFVICRLCSFGNRVYSDTINQHFNNFEKK